MQVLSELIKDFWHSNQEPMQRVKLWKQWPEVVGPRLSRLAKPLDIRDNALIVGVSDNIVMQELFYYTDEILEKIESFLGQKVFDKVKLELLNGRTPLNEISMQGPNFIHPEYKAAASGNLDLPPDTAVGSCYRAYLKMLNECKNNHYQEGI